MELKFLNWASSEEIYKPIYKVIEDFEKANPDNKIKNMPIGVGEILRIALTNDLFGITGGPNGIFGISRPTVFGYVIRRPHEFYYLIGAFLVATIFLFHRLENSRFGRAVNYLREDETAAEGSGINTAHYKLAVFVLGAAWAGMAGDIFAAKMTIISPESFSFWESVLVFLMVILGGSGSIPGVMVGAAIVVLMPEVFRDLATAPRLRDVVVRRLGEDVLVQGYLAPS